ncbi:MAG: metallopeptidase family protein [Candidatus Limnocylindrales bacterium]
MVKQRRGSRFARRPARRSVHVGFDRLVDRAIASIPTRFRAALDGVAVVIADEPTPEQLRENGLGRDETLYGLYEGVPLDEWGGDWLPVPTRILIFRLPLEEDFPDPDDLADEVRITVLHELAHHLGIHDEDRLRELGID